MASREPGTYRLGRITPDSHHSTAGPVVWEIHPFLTELSLKLDET